MVAICTATYGRTAGGTARDRQERQRGQGHLLGKESMGRLREVMLRNIMGMLRRRAPE